MGFLAAALAFYLLLTGSIPIGRSPFFFGSFSDTHSILVRSSGLILLIGLFIPSDLVAGWYGQPVILSLGLLVLFIGIVASLSGRAR